jgi:hypothetical protein
MQEVRKVKHMTKAMIFLVNSLSIATSFLHLQDEQTTLNQFYTKKKFSQSNDFYSAQINLYGC